MHLVYSETKEGNLGMGMGMAMGICCNTFHQNGLFSWLDGWRSLIIILVNSNNLVGPELDLHVPPFQHHHHPTETRRCPGVCLEMVGRY